MKEVHYGRRVASVMPAGGVSGILCRSSSGDYFFRVYKSNGQFTDYDLRHDDLKVTIAKNELASFYRIGSDKILDHSPEVLGLSKVLRLRTK